MNNAITIHIEGAEGVQDAKVIELIMECLEQRGATVECMQNSVDSRQNDNYDCLKGVGVTIEL